MNAPEVGTTSSAASTAPYSNASMSKSSHKSTTNLSDNSTINSMRSSECSSFSDATACFLKTKSSRFKKFSLGIVNEQLNFYKHESTQESTVTEIPRAKQGLNDVHITCGAIERDEMTGKWLYPVKLNNFDNVKRCR